MVVRCQGDGRKLAHAARLNSGRKSYAKNKMHSWARIISRWYRAPNTPIGCKGLVQAMIEGRENPVPCATFSDNVLNFSLTGRTVSLRRQKCRGSEGRVQPTRMWAEALPGGCYRAPNPAAARTSRGPRAAAALFAVFGAGAAAIVASRKARLRQRLYERFTMTERNRMRLVVVVFGFDDGHYPAIT